MNPVEIASALQEAAAETMESMAFLEVGPGAPEKDGLADDPKLLWSAIPVLKPTSGRVVLIIARDLAGEITEAVFGLENGLDPEDMITDALSEMVNTMAGLLMSKVTPADQAFELGLPQVGTGRPALTEPSALYRFEVEEHIMWLAVEGVFAGG